MIPMAAWCALLYKKGNDSGSMYGGGALIVTKIKPAVQDSGFLYRRFVIAFIC